MAAAPKLYSDDQVKATSGFDPKPTDKFVLDLLLNYTAEEKRKFFDIDVCTDWIRVEGYKRVALQLPDAYLGLALFLSTTLESATSAKTFVLADTSYRSCCVDLVAAEHANVDCLIHFGDSCLSDPSDKLPVLHIFGKLDVQREVIQSSLSSAFDPIVDTNFVLVVDTLFSGYFEEVLEDCRNAFQGHNVVGCPISLSLSDKEQRKFGRIVPEHVANGMDYVLIFVGLDESPLATLWQMTYPSYTDLLYFNPLAKHIEHFRSGIFTRRLRKRFYLTEKVRDANTIALVIGTLGVQGHRESVKRMRELCKTARKHLYVISVGKLNVAKLSNFASDVDVFVLLSCPFGVMLHTSDYYRPIVCFFEAEIALNPSKEWMSGLGWNPDFSECLQDAIGELREDDADVSLITGRVRSAKIVDDEGDVASKQVSLYSAGDYFEQRSWKGLDGSCDDTQTSLALEEGLSGIAAHYTSEPNK